MLNIVIPMAGRGSRFSKEGYTLPKPLIDVNGKAMIEVVTENIRPDREHRFIYLCLEEHIKEYDLTGFLGRISPGCEIVPVDRVTEGAACTVLLSREYINNDDPLMIANSDQYIDCDINDYLNRADEYDGMIMTMYADDPKWSFVGLKGDRVTLVREKEVISNEATVGIYNYRKGSDFVGYAEQMINKDIRVNNEFYVAPVYNEMIADDRIIGYYNIGYVNDGMYGLGTPRDLDFFLKNPISKGL